MNSLADILSQKADDLFSIPTAIGQDLSPNKDSSQPVEKNQLKTMIHTIKNQLDAMLRLINGETVPETLTSADASSQASEAGERIVEGNFTGSSMLGLDGKDYPVPPNYASKSKLVEGDKMKLTITRSGSFIYKQIGPVERKRVIGELKHDTALGDWRARAEEKYYKILTASVTFYKGKSGDEVIFIIPRDKPSLWGAVDNIISK